MPHIPLPNDFEVLLTITREDIKDLSELIHKLDDRLRLYMKETDDRHVVTAVAQESLKGEVRILAVKVAAVVSAIAWGVTWLLTKAGIGL